MELTYKYLGRLQQLRQAGGDEPLEEKREAIISGEWDSDDESDDFFLATLELLKDELETGETPANLIAQNTDPDGVGDNPLKYVFLNAPEEKRASRRSLFAAQLVSSLPQIEEEWMAEAVLELLTFYGPGEVEDGIRRNKFNFELLVEVLEEHPKAKGSQYIYEWLARRATGYTDVVALDRLEELFSQREGLAVCREALESLRERAAS